ncbi:MAG: hypothetical protein V2A76_13245 [Planctomycetota bacterium]
MLRTFFITLATVIALSLAPTASAQCFGPDNLDVGPCCGPVVPNLPAFPQASLPGLGVCWNNCTLASQTYLRVNWPVPVMPTCAQYNTTVTVTDATTGLALLAGPMVLDYTRTWTEVNLLTGNLVQVWRFAAKADLSSLFPAGAIPPCPIPPCLFPVGPHQSAFYYGYVDYAQDCTGVANFENVLVLHHAGDWLAHKPVYSSKPGVFHPATSYAIIAPHSPANPFVPMNLPAPAGPLLAEAVRDVPGPGGMCITEEAIAHGDLLPFVVGCMAPPSLASTQVTLSMYRGFGTCPDITGTPSNFAAQFLMFPTLPWPYLVTTSMGMWTSAAAYPGEEIAWVDEGLFKYYDSCVSLAYYEVFYGGSTDEGWPVVPTFPPHLQTQKFKDLADNWSVPVVGPKPLPLMGHIMPTNHLIYTNTP